MTFRFMRAPSYWFILFRVSEHKCADIYRYHAICIHISSHLTYLINPIMLAEDYEVLDFSLWEFVLIPVSYSP